VYFSLYIQQRSLNVTKWLINKIICTNTDSCPGYWLRAFLVRKQDFRAENNVKYCNIFERVLNSSFANRESFPFFQKLTTSLERCSFEIPCYTNKVKILAVGKIICSGFTTNVSWIGSPPSLDVLTVAYLPNRGFVSPLPVYREFHGTLSWQLATILVGESAFITTYRKAVGGKRRLQTRLVATTTSTCARWRRPSVKWTCCGEFSLWPIPTSTFLWVFSWDTIKTNLHNYLNSPDHYF